jgi:hypothetical protein
VAVGTVKSRLHRGRAALRRLLKPEAEGASDAPDGPPGTSETAASSHTRRP